MGIQALIAALEAACAAFGAELQRAATWVIHHPREVGLLSMRQQALQAGVTPNTMIRLAQAVGYDSYVPFRQVFQDALRHGGPGYRERVQQLQEKAPASFDDALLQTHLHNVQSPTQRNTPAALAQAVQRMRGARRVFFLGTRSCFAISYHFAYAYSMIVANGTLVHGLGGAYPDQLDSAEPGDLLVCITQNPYGRQALEAAQICHRAGVQVLALTDSPLAPILAYTSQALWFDADTPSYFHSMVGSLALVERLLAKLAASGDQAMLERIETFEQRLGASNAYLAQSRKVAAKPRKSS